MSNSLKKGAWNTFKRLFGYISPYWELKAVVVIIIFTTMFSILSPAIVGNIIDTVGYVATGESIPEATGIEDEWILGGVIKSTPSEIPTPLSNNQCQSSRFGNNHC